MVCSRCGKDKDPCLFTPSQVKRINIGHAGYCRKCVAELNGQVPFGIKEAIEGRKRGRKTIIKAVKRIDQRFSSKAIVDEQETKRLLALHKARLHPVVDTLDHGSTHHGLVG